MKLTSKSLAVLVLGIIFGSISFTTAMGWWSTESQKVPARFTSGENTGEYNPADIRGSYTFGEISDLFQIPLQDLGTAFNIPADLDLASFQVKTLETLNPEANIEIGTSSIRLFVAWYKQLPYEILEDTYLLQSAVDILKNTATLSAEQLTYLETHTAGQGILSPITSEAQTPVPPTSSEDPNQSTEIPHTEGEDRTIKGKTNFQEVLDWGVSKEKIELIIGAPMPNPLTLIKDYCSEKGLEFGDIKTLLQAEIDQISP